MKFLEKIDRKLLQAFIEHKNVDYIKQLKIRYEMEYYDILASEILKNKEKLSISLNAKWDEKMNNEINNYVHEYGTFEDKKYFHLVKVVLNIANKYYNELGELREIYRKNSKQHK